MNVSNRQIERMVRKMSLRAGDVLLIKAGTEIAKIETITEIVSTCEKIVDGRVLVLVVDDFNDMTKTKETALNATGWFHIDALSRIVRAVKEKEDAKNNSPESG